MMCDASGETAKKKMGEKENGFIALLVEERRRGGGADDAIACISTSERASVYF